jgi:hypothetical protein
MGGQYPAASACAALIEKLAKAKQLNPATGRPLPTSPDFEKDSVARLQCRSGEPCPQSGYWQPAWRPREGMSEHAIRYFREGDIMPVEKVTFVRPRPGRCATDWSWKRRRRCGAVSARHKLCR